MDTREDLAHYAIEKKYGPQECPCEGTCELAYKIGGEVYHYKDIWEKIEDEHYPMCPVAIAAGRKAISTLCVCKEIADAEKDADIEKWDRKEEKGS